MFKTIYRAPQRRLLFLYGKPRKNYIKNGSIVEMFIWYLLLCLVIGGSLALAAFVLPKIYLSTRYTITQPTDRGIKKILEKSGQSMLFEPALKYRKYLKQYVLAERYGKKELICK